MNRNAADRTETERRIDHMQALLRERKSVDLCDFGELKLFLYTDDFFYGNVPPENRGYRLAAEDVERVQERRYERIDGDELYRGPDVLGVLMSHFWINGLDFTYVDVGCPYGITAISAAKVIEASGHDNLTICFEPGIGAGLVRQNIALNGFTDRIVFEQKAVSDHCLPLILSSSLHHSEGNRTVNRDRALEDISFVVDNTSLDGYLRGRRLSTHLIVKIDTEGAEYEIWKGMRETLKERYVASIWEFQPNFLATRIDPSCFLELVGRDAYLLDIGQSHVESTSAALIDETRLDTFVDGVLGAPNQWTDVLALPRRLPGVEQLLRRLGVEADAGESKDRAAQRVWYGRGWYGREPHGRWIGPSSEMTVRDARGRSLIVDCYLPPEVLRDAYGGELRVRFVGDGKTLLESRIVHTEDDDGLFTLRLDRVEKEEIGLRIELDKSFSPSRLGTGDDARELGLFVRRVEAE